jgi:hypothetical protein
MKKKFALILSALTILLFIVSAKAVTIQSPVPFMGMSDEIFTLSDGSIYKVGIGEYNYLYSYYPNVVVVNNTITIQNKIISVSNVSKSCSKSSILSPSPFMGMSGDVFTLSNGSMYKVGVGEYNYLYSYYPNVIICDDNSLHVDDKAISVSNVSKSCSKSSILSPSPFMGMSGDVFTLSNGSMYKVGIGEYNYLYSYYPNVIICDDNSLHVDGKAISVSKIGALPIITPKPTCTNGQVLNATQTACITPVPTCTNGQVLNATQTACITPVPTCTNGQVLNTAKTACITPVPTCTNGQVLNATQTACITPVPTCTNGQVLNTAKTACINSPIVVITSGKTIVGTSSNDLIIGTIGNDTLNGGLGKDTLIGSNGDDIYVVDNKDDKIIENLDEGIDSVQSKISYVLGNNLENLELLGSSNINATGNTLDNELSGNDSNNILNGMAGDDTLIGGKGNDKLIGGKGADTFKFNIDDFFSKDENGNFIFNKSIDTIVDFNLKDNDTLVFFSSNSMFSSDYLEFYPDLASAKFDQSELFYVKGTIYLNIDTTAKHYTPVAIIKLTGNPKVNNDFTDFAYPAVL